VERLRLEQEIAALQRAAGGATDPAAAGLTLRQRLIALALQERQLRQQELGLEEQRRPLVQELQARIEALTEEQRLALEPLERSLATQRERIDALQLERQRWEQLRGEIQAAIDAVNAAPVQAKTAAPDAAEVETRKQELERIGTEFGERFQRGWETWLAAGGGDVWKAIGAHLQQWYDTDGKPLAERVGTDLARAIGGAIGRELPEAIKAGIGGAVETYLQGRQPPAPGEAGGARVPAGGAAPGAAPPGPPLPLVGRGVVPAPAARPGPPPVNVNVDVGALQVAEQGRQARIDELTDTLGREVATAVVDSLIAAEQGTDPGPGLLVQGAGR
jgi:hypothetical protein